MRITEVTDPLSGDITVSCYHEGMAYHERLTRAQINAAHRDRQDIINITRTDLVDRMNRYMEQISATQYEVNSRRVDAASGYYTTGVGQQSFFHHSINNNAVWKDNIHYTKTVTISEWDTLIRRLNELEESVIQLKAGANIQLYTDKFEI